MNNWFGIVGHPTDDFIHWKDRDPRATAERMRSAYDALATDVESTKRLEFLIQCAYDAGRINFM